jgi:hypothetical protein
LRLSDLLRAEVLDRNGESVGHVHDVRCVRDGPVQGAFGPSYRLVGLIVGSASIRSRLGLDRADVTGPAPLKAVLRWFHGDAKFVEWPSVSAIDGNTIRLSVAKNDLPPVPQLTGR